MIAVNTKYNLQAKKNLDTKVTSLNKSWFAFCSKKQYWCIKIYIHQLYQ